MDKKSHLVASNTVYVRVTRNQFRVKNVESGKEKTVIASPEFTTSRLLVGQFQDAERILKRAIAEVTSGGLLAQSPRVLMHPLEMVEGGLSEVEERVMRELAVGAARATRIVVWTGRELTDPEVKEKLSAKV